MLKRIFDITFSSIGLGCILPVLAIVAFLIKTDSPGPVFYRGKRVGLKGKEFRIYKFRTMVVGADNIGGPSAAFHDPRFTRIGRFLRKYKLDELPQLINILCGEMSFVGPRPQVAQYTDRYSDEENVILSVRPGLTDYASIKFINLDAILGDNDVDVKYLTEIEPEKNRLRIRYVKEHSFSTDMKILFQTLKALLRL